MPEGFPDFREGDDKDDSFSGKEETSSESDDQRPNAGSSIEVRRSLGAQEAVKPSLRKGKHIENELKKAK